MNTKPKRRRMKSSVSKKKPFDHSRFVTSDEAYLYNLAYLVAKKEGRVRPGYSPNPIVRSLRDRRRTRDNLKIVTP